MEVCASRYKKQAGNSRQRDMSASIFLSVSSQSQCFCEQRKYVSVNRELVSSYSSLYLISVATQSGERERAEGRRENRDNIPLSLNLDFVLS